MLYPRATEELNPRLSETNEVSERRRGQKLTTKASNKNKWRTKQEQTTKKGCSYVFKQNISSTTKAFGNSSVTELNIRTTEELPLEQQENYH